MAMGDVPKLKLSPPGWQSSLSGGAGSTFCQKFWVSWWVRWQGWRGSLLPGSVVKTWGIWVTVFPGRCSTFWTAVQKERCSFSVECARQTGAEADNTVDWPGKEKLVQKHKAAACCMQLSGSAVPNCKQPVRQATYVSDPASFRGSPASHAILSCGANPLSISRQEVCGLSKTA